MKAKLLRVHVSEGDKHAGHSLHEALVARCRELGIAGATVFRGLEGYGETAAIHRHPIVITIIDTAENINRLLPEVERMLDTGMIAVSDVEMIRVHKTGKP
jgi:uncharacterized protein